MITLPTGTAIFETRSEHKSVEVLAVNGNAVVRAKMTYLVVNDGSMRGGAITKRPKPVQGRTYTLTSGLPTKIESDGGPGTDTEADLVRDREPHFGSDDPVAKALNGRTFPLGKTVGLPAPVLGAMRDDLGKLTKWTLTFRGTTGTNARFDTTMRIEDVQLGFTAELTGTAVIDLKTAMVSELEIEGKAVATGPTSGDGKMSVSWRVLR